MATGLTDVFTTIPNDDFALGMTQTVKALRGGTPRDMFTGIIQAASGEALVEVLGDAIYIGIVLSKGLAEKRATRDFGEAIIKITDAALRERFGPNVSLNYLESRQIGVK